MADVKKKWITDWTSYAFNGAQALNAALDDEWVSLGEELNNTALGKAVFVDFHLHLDSAIFTGADSAVELYLVPAGNADVYPDFTANVITDEQENNKHYVDSFTTSGATLAQELYARDIELPPGKFKLGARNKANVTLAASNTLYFRLWSHGSE